MTTQHTQLVVIIFSKIQLKHCLIKFIVFNVHIRKNKAFNINEINKNLEHILHKK